MRLNAEQIQQAIEQLEAQPIPKGHWIMPHLERRFGEHTYFIGKNGLHIVEPAVGDAADSRRGVVVSLATWTGETSANLEPHDPEPTALVIEIDAKD